MHVVTADFKKGSDERWFVVKESSGISTSYISFVLGLAKTILGTYMCHIMLRRAWIIAARKSLNKECNDACFGEVEM